MDRQKIDQHRCPKHDRRISIQNLFIPVFRVDIQTGIDQPEKADPHKRYHITFTDELQHKPWDPVFIYDRDHGCDIQAHAQDRNGQHPQKHRLGVQTYHLLPQRKI